MDYPDLIKNFGVPIVVMMVMTLGIVYVARFFVKEVYFPIRDKIIERVVKFFDNLDCTITRIDGHGVKIESAMDRVEKKLDLLEDYAENTEESCQRIEAKVCGTEPARQTAPRRTRRQGEHPPG